MSMDHELSLEHFGTFAPAWRLEEEYRLLWSVECWYWTPRLPWFLQPSHVIFRSHEGSAKIAAETADTAPKVRASFQAVIEVCEEKCHILKKHERLFALAIGFVIYCRCVFVQSSLNSKTLAMQQIEVKTKKALSCIRVIVEFNKPIPGTVVRCHVGCFGYGTRGRVLRAWGWLLRSPYWMVKLRFQILLLWVTSMWWHVVLPHHFLLSHPVVYCGATAIKK